MNSKKSGLEQIEGRIFRTTNLSDGLLDILIGGLLLGNSFGPMLLDQGIPLPWNFVIIPLPVYLLFWYARKNITGPRIGYIRSGTIRKKKNRGLLYINILAFFFTGLVFILSSLAGWDFPLGKYSNIIFLGVFGFVIPISLIGYFLEYNRLIVYAWLILVAWLIFASIRASMTSEWAWVMTFGTVGMLYIIIGVVTFLNFIQRYPLADLDPPEK